MEEKSICKKGQDERTREVQTLHIANIAGQKVTKAHYNQYHDQIITASKVNLQPTSTLIPQAQVFQLSQAVYFYESGERIVIRIERAKIGHRSYMELM
jgi:hypothetical protein